jgi:IclR family transcriptional regulator, KDG regulon repressor
MATRKKGKTVTASVESSGKQVRVDTTFIKGMNVLELMSLADRPLSVAELAQSTKLAPSNVHRILSTLFQMQYVSKNEQTSRYQLNLKIWEVGVRVMERNLLRRVSRPFLRRMNEETKEAAFLNVKVGDEMLYMDSVDAILPLRSTARLGARAPIAFTASGKAVLAFAPDGDMWVRRLVAENTTGRELNENGLLAQLAEIRRNGFAFSTDNWVTGISTVAAPIFMNDIAFASIGMSIPTERSSDEKVSQMSSLVLNAAIQISEILGASPDAIQ